MTDHDLIERLRDLAYYVQSELTQGDGDLVRKAAARIEALSARVTDLENEIRNHKWGIALPGL